jgi:hypothetical protein
MTFSEALTAGDFSRVLALAYRRQARIVTEYVFPPIPDRSNDWLAYVDGSIDVCGDAECGCRSRVRIGRGASEDEAVSDLMEKMA